MDRRKIVVAAVISVSLGFSGCAVLLLGAGGAAGYAVSKDSVKNTFDLSKEFVYKQSLGVAKDMGLVTLEDHTHGQIQLRVANANVTITVKPLTKKTVELEVKARNPLLMPELDVAQAVYNKILERL